MTQSANQKNNKSNRKTGRLSLKNNREFAVVTYLFFILFLAMILYFVYFQAVKSESFINSPYNSLQDLLSEYVIRGEIRSSDGYVLARTDVDEQGNETRVYPYGNTFAHAVGYAVNGKSGLESQVNFSLLRSHHFVGEQIANNLENKKSMGDTVVTTLNYDLQNAAFQALGNYDGAVIVMEPATGKILAMVSKPSYDPNTILENWDQINADGSTMLFNRATQGQYTPGSVFKIFTTLEYYQEHSGNDWDYEYVCNSSFTYEGQTIHCSHNKSHNQETLRSSFANSCNSSYANLSLGLNQNRFQQLCNSLLFNQSLPVDFVSSVSKVSMSDEDNSFMIMQTAIGQGNTVVSPLHMLMIVSAIDADGVCMRPYLVDHIENDKGVMVSQTKSSEYAMLFTAQEADFLKDYMRGVVEEGTASKLNGLSYEAYGKTGTAQISDTSDDTNAWFVGFAQKEGYEDIAIAVVVEKSGSGSSYAVPVAKTVFDTYFQ